MTDERLDELTAACSSDLGAWSQERWWQVALSDSLTALREAKAREEALRGELAALRAAHANCHTKLHTSTPKDQRARARKRLCFTVDGDQYRIAPRFLCFECRAYSECLNDRKPRNPDADGFCDPLPLDEALSDTRATMEVPRG